MRLIALTSLLLFLYSCQPKSKKLFRIDQTSSLKNDFLYMAESTNVENIGLDSIQHYLEPDEITETGLLLSPLILKDSTISKNPIFKHFGEIYKNNKFKLSVIFRDGNNTIGRDYRFILRTYDHGGAIIDSYELATWVRDKRYCFGSIDENLTIQRKCKSDNKRERHQLTQNGSFISIE